ncbi:hypothetical protein KEM54_006081 [Ascosphaera aggregata]|nr:hypothetical protein KEM54_006081 [Ascosphaera aggregata]
MLVPPEQPDISQSSAREIATRQSAARGIRGHAFGILHFAGCRLGQMSSFRGIPLIYPDGQRWVENVTGEKVSFDRLYGKKGTEGSTPRIFQQSFNDEAGTVMMTTESGLPPRWLIEECHRCFCISVRRLSFPIVDPVLFQRTISLAYDEEALRTAHFECTNARAAIFAFLSFLSILLPEMIGHLEIDRDRCANEALKLLPYATMSTSLDGLQALLALTLYFQFTGEVDTASMHKSNACSAVIRLGGHCYPEPPVEATGAAAAAAAAAACSIPSPSSMDARIVRHIRILFWLAFTIDFMVSLHSGLPPTFNIYFCDLTLPPRYEEMYTQQAAHGILETLPHGADYDPWFPGDLRLTIIQAKAHVKLYSHHAMFKSDAELLRDIRELDVELDAWRESVPSLFRPSWVHSQHLPTSRHLSTVILRLLFYHTIALIHRASSRCEAWSNMQPRWDIDALGSSLALSVEASRSSLLYMSSIADRVAERFFSMVLIFPMTSFLVLFSNLLLSPLDDQAASDLILLEQVPDTIKRLKFRIQSQRENSHVKRVYDFVSELVRLGKCAVAKARREKEHQIQENMQ